MKGSSSLSGVPPSGVDKNAFFAIANSARQMPDWVLVLLETSGFVTALAIYAWTPRSLEALPLFIGVGALGLFGIVDHVLQAPPRLRSWRRSTLRGFHFLTAVVAVLCALATVFVLTGWMIGTFIS